MGHERQSAPRCRPVFATSAMPAGSISEQRLAAVPVEVGFHNDVCNI
jgi:hypothetical protein